jgi:hypothetical protein
LSDVHAYDVEVLTNIIVAAICSVNGAAARTGAPSIAVDLLNMLHGAISSDKIDSLRSKLGFLELDRFRPSSHHDHPDLQYSPQSRSVQWGGPSGLSPEQVRYETASYCLCCCSSIAKLHCAGFIFHNFQGLSI